MSAQLEHARFLRERHRYAESISVIYQYLASYPDDFSGHFELALTRLQENENLSIALDDIDRAIALEPECAGAHAIRANILCFLQRYEEAIKSAKEALSLDPEMSFAWLCLSKALLGMKNFHEALQAVRKALELDPESDTALDLLSMILRFQGRLQESDDANKRDLALDPENALAFASAGWIALNKHDWNEAKKLFLEALRINPNLEKARHGLKEAHKGRSRLIWLFSSKISFANKHDINSQWSAVSGIAYTAILVFILPMIMPSLAVAVIVLLYLILQFGSWISNSIGHFVLLMNRGMRASMTASEKKDGLLVGVFLFAGLAFLIAGLWVLPIGYAYLGWAMIGATVPGSMIFNKLSTKIRSVFGVLCTLILACGAVALIFSNAEDAINHQLNWRVIIPSSVGLLLIVLSILMIDRRSAKWVLV